MNCPGCQKLYFVRPEDLSPGEARFQCTACSKMFAFTWPQPPEVQKVVAREIAPETMASFTPASRPPQAQATVGQLRTCGRCGEKVDVKFTECPKCGVILDKARKAKTIDPVAKGATPELAAAWEGVKTNYADEPRHESFIQLCLSRENLAFASTQYRAMLDANPSDELANRMQSRIIELATFSYITSQTKDVKEKPKYAGFTKFITALSGIFIITGLCVPPLRPMVAVGVSTIIFVFTARYFAMK